MLAPGRQAETTMKRTSFPRLVVRGALSLLLMIPLTAFSQILQYGFNDTGTTSASTGSDTTSVEFQNSSYVATDLHGGPGSGVSGAAGDFSFNNTASTGMGAAGIGGRANGGDIDAIDSLSSVTIQLWYKTSETGSWGSARLLEKTQGLNALLSLQVGGDGTNPDITFVLGTPTVGFASASTGSLDSKFGAGSWVFFAVTYDGTLTTNNVEFYAGTTSSTVESLGTFTVNNGPLGPNTGAFQIGNDGYNRPWDGEFDNLRIFGATSGNGGVLNQSQLEALRSVDVVPEPTSMALVILAGTVLLPVLRRSRRGVAGPSGDRFAGLIS